ncbi:MAG: aldehyde dehydrogenase family protein [Gemmatimonadales bacterium]
MPPSSGPAAAQAPPVPAPTPRGGLDESVERLHGAASAFAALPIDQRLQLLRAMRAGYARTAPRLVEISCLAKRIVPGTVLEGEEWSLGPWPVLRQFRLLIEALSAIQQRGRPPFLELGRTVDGRLSAEVFPGSILDALLIPSTRAEVHIRAGIGERELLSSQARFYKQSATPGRVVLVLGPGNSAGVPVQIVLTRMFNEGKVCLLKLHPLNGYLLPLLVEAFAEAIAANYLQIVNGGPAEGAYLSQHPGIDEIHLSGSPETHETMLWGSAQTGATDRKRQHHPLHSKPVTSVLGGVSPVLVVPGPYLDRQLAFQAEALAGALVHNAAANCHTPRLLVTPKGWPQRDTFLRHLLRALAAAPLRLAYYPGTAERWERVTKGRPELLRIGAAVGGMLPWTLVPGLDPSDRREPLFTGESFCPVLGEVELASNEPIEFLQQAVGFVNERVWGSLAAMLIVHPRTEADPQLYAAVARAISQLRYGAVGVNVWPAQLSAIGSAPWGGHPSSVGSDVQSGRGWVHNTAMLEEVEKSVIRQPVTVKLKPAYAPGHRSAHSLLRRLTAVERGAGWSGLPGILDAALRS